MTRRAALPLLLLCAAAPGPAALPAVPVYRSFGHWLVACDNTRFCEAKGFGDSSQADLRLRRAAGDAAVRLTLSLDSLGPDRPALSLDGAPVAASGWRHQPAGPDSGATLATEDPAAVAGFVAAARRAASLRIGAGGAEVPLDGFTAALLLVDAVQGRPGTPTALIAATGPARPPPAPPVPDAPPWQKPPPLTAAESRTLLARAAAARPPEGTTCDATEAPELHALDASQALAIRPCESFAYQTGALVLLLPRGGGGPVRPVVLRLPGLPDAASATMGPEMTDAGFDPATGRLTSSAKGRGPADCGISAGWVWHSGAFRLVGLDFQESCGGAAPGDWPTLFRTAPGR